MKERYQIRCAVFLILTKMEDGKKYVLLQRRFHTGILDGKYDVSCSGHLEPNETVKQAMIRETKEEIGIDIKEEDLIHSSTMHVNVKEAEYLFIVFSCNQYNGIPTIMEPDKCDNLEWFAMNELPENLADTRKIMIKNYQENNHYSEYGFK